MDKPSYKLVGLPCGQHGQYTFYKALRVSCDHERIIAIGDFFFVRLWQDSELVSIGELQLLWTDRVSDQTLVSLRLYFLPENTPDGRNLHGEDEVLAINDKVVVRAEDLLSWVCDGTGWRWGLRAVWRGACAPPVDVKHSSPLHHTKLDFSDVEREKNAIVTDEESPGVMVFSYPRYCRYRALLVRLEGIQGDWLRDSLVAALGGYAAPTKNTRILYCKETFEYPELEGHVFVCNHLAPRLKGRPRGRRRRRARSRSLDRSTDTDSDARVDLVQPSTPRRPSLRNGAESEEDEKKVEEIKKDESKDAAEDDAFLEQLRLFYKERNEPIDIDEEDLKDLSLVSLYGAVVSRGGYAGVCARRGWRTLLPRADHPARARALYERYLLPYENHERKNGRKNGKIEMESINIESDKEENEMNITRKPAEELNREFLESLPTVQAETVTDLFKSSDVNKIFDENKVVVRELVEKCRVLDSTVLSELGKHELSEGSKVFLSELAVKLNLGASDPLAECKPPESNALSSLSALGDKYVNGHTTPIPEQKSSRPLGKSSLRAVRVKPARPQHNIPPSIPPVGSESSSPPTMTPTPTPNPTPNPTPTPTPTPITNFGIHRPQQINNQSDDEIMEVPYKPKTPEIIDLDEYPESPQSVKKKKLDILKERGLEVTAIPTPNWATPMMQNPITPLINPTPIILNPVQHQIMTQAQLYQMYNILPPNINGALPPRVVQASSIFGTSGPQKIVYGNPKDPFMPPPHVLHGAPMKPQRKQVTPPPQDILDLTCKQGMPAVEIVKVPNVPSPKNTGQNLSKNYPILDGKSVGSNLEITLVNSKVSPTKGRPPQKRSSNGKFMSLKTPTPPKDYPKPQSSPSSVKKTPIVVPNYQIPRDEASPTSSNSSKDSQNNMQSLLAYNQNYAQMRELQKPQMPYIDPYMALYSLGQVDPRQIAFYRDFMSSQLKNYSGLNLNAGIPTTKN